MTESRNSEQIGKFAFVKQKVKRIFASKETKASKQFPFEKGFFLYNPLVHEYEYWSRYDPEVLSGRRTPESNPKLKEKLKKQIEWYTTYNQRVPKSWRTTDGIRKDLENADRRNIELQPILKQACITHFDLDVAINVGLHQTLFPQQLAQIFKRLHEMNLVSKNVQYDDDRVAIISAQLRKGLTLKDIENANGMAYSPLIPTPATH